MQFHHHGYVSGDPRVQNAAGTGVDRPERLPDEVDVLIVGSGPAGMLLAAQMSQFPQLTTRLIEKREGRLPLGQADGIGWAAGRPSQSFWSCLGSMISTPPGRRWGFCLGKTGRSWKPFSRSCGPAIKRKGYPPILCLTPLAQTRKRRPASMGPASLTRSERPRGRRLAVIPSATTTAGNRGRRWPNSGRIWARRQELPGIGGAR